MPIEVRSTSFAPTSGSGDIWGSSVTVNRPSGVQVGDFLIAFVARSQTARNTSGFVATGWNSRGFAAGSSSFPPVGVLTRTVVSGEASSYSFRSSGYSGIDQFVVHILALTGVDTNNPILAGPTKRDASNNTSQVVAPSLTLPDSGLLLCWFSALDYQSGTSFSTPSGMVERIDRGGTWLHAATATEVRASGGSTGTRTSNHSTTPDHPPRALAIALREIARTVSPDPIPSGETFGQPAVLGTTTLDVTAIPSGLVFGTTVVEYPKVRPDPIESTAEFGLAARLVPGRVILGGAGGITAPEAFGEPRLRTSLNIAGQINAARRSITYDLVMMSRIPSASGPPTFLAVDAIPWSSLAWAEELSKPQRLDVSVSMANLSDAVLRRLINARDMPTELHLYRGSQLVFAGPFMNAQRQAETITMYAQGLLGYARYWIVEEDLVFSQVDQFTIVKDLIDHWQGLEYGHFGIDTSQVTTSGMLRDATYLAKENHNIGQRIEELGKRINGFDVDVDPITRALRLYHPIKGVDRSAGEDAIVIDSSNVTNGDVAWSVGPDDVASEAYGSGTSNDVSLRAHASNLDLRAQFGRVGVASSFDGVSVQDTLDGHTQALLDARAEPLFIPGPDVRVTPDTDPTMYGVGDTVAYVLTDRLGVQGAFRIRKRTIKVSNTGRELASFEFA